jgi:hypothetical protein
LVVGNLKIPNYVIQLLKEGTASKWLPLIKFLVLSAPKMAFVSLPSSAKHFMSSIFSISSLNCSNLMFAYS